MGMFENMVEKCVCQATKKLVQAAAAVPAGISEALNNKTPVKQSHVSRLAGNVIKSPSDTTLYVPGLRMSTALETPGVQACNQTVINQVYNFVEQMRLETAPSATVSHC